MKEIEKINWTVEELINELNNASNRLDGAGYRYGTNPIHSSWATIKPKRLFIIGNGMDVDHGINTNWKDIFSSDIKVSMDTDGKITEIWNFQKLANHRNIWGNMLFQKESKLWSDFEKRLGEIALFFDFVQNLCDGTNLPNNIADEIYAKADEIKIDKKVVDELIEIINFHKRRLRIPNFTGSYEPYNSLKMVVGPNAYRAANWLRQVIANYIRELWNKPYKPKEKYTNLFSDKDFFVINYNYTDFNSNVLNYYNHSSELHIHGKVLPLVDAITAGVMIPSFILDKDEYEKMIREVKHDHSSYSLMIGLYNLKEKHISDHYWSIVAFDKGYFNKSSDKIDSLTSEYAPYFKEAIWRSHNGVSQPFRKGIDLSTVNEIIIIGHSLSGVDIPYLNRRITTFNRNKNYKITYYTYFEPGESSDQLEKDKVKNIFPNVNDEDITIINNYDDI